MLTVAEIHKALGFNEFMSETTKVLLTQIANAAIAAYRAKLRKGVELPEPELHDGVTVTAKGKYKSTEDGYTKDQLQQYGDARDHAGYLRGLETALIKVTGLSVDDGRCKQLQLTTQAWEEALDAAASAIEKLKGGE